MVSYKYPVKITGCLNNPQHVSQNAGAAGSKPLWAQVSWKQPPAANAATIDRKSTTCSCESHLAYTKQTNQMSPLQAHLHARLFSCSWRLGARCAHRQRKGYWEGRKSAAIQTFSEHGNWGVQGYWKARTFLMGEREYFLYKPYSSFPELLQDITVAPQTDLPLELLF